RPAPPPHRAPAALRGRGAAVPRAGPPPGAVWVLAVWVLGALGTLAAGSWQGARYIARREAAAACTGSCASCTLSCH
ncbi:hypothetical protein, partial [Mycobacterium talmoniae]|uniref:hypothetical protein n=1 Tax=Mycobacterium talmoniae TaxID=1858794 RepID=UPI001A965764